MRGCRRAELSPLAIESSLSSQICQYQFVKNTVLLLMHEALTGVWYFDIETHRAHNQ